MVESVTKIEKAMGRFYGSLPKISTKVVKQSAIESRHVACHLAVANSIYTYQHPQVEDKEEQPMVHAVACDILLE